MASVGSIQIDLSLNTEDFGKKINKSMKDASKTINNSLGKSLSSFKSNLSVVNSYSKGISIINSKLNKTSSIVSTLSSKLAAAFSIYQIVRFSKSCIDASSNLIEVQNVMYKTFEGASGKMQDFIDKSNEIGLSFYEATKFGSALGSIFKTAGVSKDINEIELMSENMLQKISDIASFHNMTTQEAFLKIKSGISGVSTRPLMELGINLSENVVKAYALEHGLEKDWKSLSYGEKVLWRYKSLLEQSKDSMNDYKETSKSWANQIKTLTLNFNNLKVELGSGLINTLTPLLGIINQLIAKLTILATKFKELTIAIFGDASSYSNASSEAIDELVGSAEDAANTIDGIGEASKKAAKETKSAFSFDELNKLSDNSSSSEDSNSIETIEQETNAQDELNIATSKYQETIDKLKSRLLELKNIFLEKYNLALDTTGFNDSLSSLEVRIDTFKEKMKSIFNSDVVNAAKSCIDSIVGFFGTLAGSINGVYTAFKNGFMGGVLQYLSKNETFLNESFVTILDNIGISFDNMGTKIEDIGTKLSTYFNSEEFQNKVAIILEQVINPLVEGLLWVSENIDKIIIVIGKLMIALGVIKILGMLSPLLTSIRTAFSVLTTTISLAGSAFSMLGSVIGFICSPIGLLVAAIAGLIIYMGYLYKTNEDFRNRFNEAWNNIKETFIRVYEENLKPALERLGEVILGLKPILDIIVNAIVDKIMPIIAKVIEFVGVAVEFIILAASDIIEVIGNFVDFASDSIEMLINGILDFIGGFIDSLTGLLDIIIGLATNNAEKINKGCDKLTKGIINIFKGFGETILGVLGTLFAAIWKILESLFGDTVKAGLDFLDSVGNWLLDIFDNIVNFFKKHNLVEVGKNLIQGLLDGIKSAKDFVINGVKDIGDGIKDKFCDIFNIHSPSRWMRDIIGENLMKGFEIGIDTNTDGALNSILDFSDKVKGSLTQIPSLAFTGEQGNLDYSYEVDTTQDDINTKQNEQIISLLTQLVNKDSNIYMDGTLIGNKQINYQNKESRRKG